MDSWTYQCGECSGDEMSMIAMRGVGVAGVLRRGTMSARNIKRGVFVLEKNFNFSKEN